MKTALLAGALLIAAASAPAPPEAKGRGTMSFGHEDEGRAFLRFDVKEGEPIIGSLTFAAEHHHDHAMFPDIVVTLGSIQTVKFDAASVEFSGPGHLHDDPVTITVRAYDRKTGDEEGASDRFVIECVDAGGRTVFDADGKLFRGDIAVRAGKGERR